MLSKAEVRTLVQTFTPPMLSSQSASSGLTETVILAGPIRVFAIGVTNLGSTGTFRFVDGANTPANHKIFLGELIGAAEEFDSWAPGFVKFTTEIRMVRSVTDGDGHWTIFYQPDT